MEAAAIIERSMKRMFSADLEESELLITTIKCTWIGQTTKTWTILKPVWDEESFHASVS